MSWYHTREAGNDGQDHRRGTPRCVHHRRGPGRSATHERCAEMIAYLADILTISEEDRAVHGDISPGDVFVDERGSVSLAMDRCAVEVVHQKGHSFPHRPWSRCGAPRAPFDTEPGCHSS